MTPRVSVVVATYNYARFLGGALESALGQTFRDLEVIVVDDGSTDDTAAVVRPYLADGRVSYVRTDHVGQPAAKNVGVRLARAPLVAFLDADDRWLPAKLARQVPLFDADPGLGVVYARRRLIDEEGWPLEYEQPVLHRGEVLGPLFERNFVCFSSAVARREVLECEGLFDEALPLAIDFDLWLRVARHYRFDYVDEPLVEYRVGHASLSRRQDERLRRVL
ncbi:MAG TPA: glycosyltransferase, partial [Gemmataceae bacterium]|nr:glycosyltransferase [Gemmataceae bacterium]